MVSGQRGSQAFFAGYPRGRAMTHEIHGGTRVAARPSRWQRLFRTTLIGCHEKRPPWSIPSILIARSYTPPVSGNPCNRGKRRLSPVAQWLFCGGFPPELVVLTMGEKTGGCRRQLSLITPAPLETAAYLGDGNEVRLRKPGETLYRHEGFRLEYVGVKHERKARLPRGSV